MSMHRVFSCCWKRVFAMTSAFSWQKCVSLCPASFCTPRPNLPDTPGIFWLPTFAFQFPVMKRTSFLGLVLEGLVGLHRTIQFQFLQHYWSGHRLGLLWYWMVCLEMNRDHSVVFEIVAQLVKNLLAMQETWVRYLGWEDPLEKELATHPSILA